MLEVEQPKEKGRNKLVVEIGSDGRPSFSDGNRLIAHDEFYVTVNRQTVHNDQRPKRPTGAELEKIKLGDRKDFSPIIGDGTRAFPEESIDELIYTNVFSYPRTSAPMELLLDGIKKLKKDGRIIITETYTPDLFQPQEMVEFNRKGQPLVNEEAFRMVGLQVELVSTEKKIIRLYNNRGVTDGKHYEDKRAFVLILKKI